MIDFFPERSLDELIRQAREDVASWEKYIDSHGESIMSELPEAEHERMRQDPDITVDVLKSSHPLQRLAALYLVYNYWISHPQFVSICLHLAFHDTMKEVRGLAILCLPRLRDHVNDSDSQLRRLLTAVRPGNSTMEKVYEKERAALRHSFNEKNLEDWRENAGPLLDKMLVSAEETEHYLQCQDQRVRYVALSMLTYHWEASPEVAACALRITSNSSSPVNIKCAAIRLLGHYSARTNDRPLGSLLASIVANETEETLVRRSAYSQLYSIRGLPASARPSWSTLLSFPANVDWAFVRSFLSHQTNEDAGGGQRKAQA